MVKIARKSVVYTVALGIGCIILGVVTGIAIEKQNTKQKFLKYAAAKQQRGKKFYQQMAQHAGKKLLEALEDKLDLTQEQKDQVVKILEETRERVKNLQDKNFTVITQIKEEGHAQILEILNPEQQEKFKQLVKEAEEKKKQRREKFGHKFGQEKPQR